MNLFSEARTRKRIIGSSGGCPKAAERVWSWEVLGVNGRSALAPFAVVGMGVLCASVAMAQEFRDPTAILRELAPLAVPQRQADGVVAAPPELPARASLDLDIQFAVNSAELAPQALRQVEALAAALKSAQLSDRQVLIAGHTDATGAADQNVILSFRRANAVRDYLVVTHGIDPGRIATVGYGEERIKDKSNPAGAANRRVEITVLGRIVVGRR